MRKPLSTYSSRSRPPITTSEGGGNAAFRVRRGTGRGNHITQGVDALKGIRGRRRRAARRSVAPATVAVLAFTGLAAFLGSAGAAPAGAATPASCPVGSGAPCQQAFFQFSKSTGAVTGAVALPGANAEGQDYDGVVCEGAGTSTCYLAADRNGFLLATVSSLACNPVATITPVGQAADFTIDSMAYDPANSTLFASVGDQMNTLNPATGALTQTRTWMGDAMGAGGTVEVDHLDALTYDAATGDLLGVVDQGSRAPLLVHLSPSTGAVVPGAFGSGLDYVAVAPDGTLGAVNGIAFSGGTLYAALSNNDQSSTDPHLATMNPATGATTDVGPAGVPSVGGLTADSAGNIYGVSGTGGAVVSTLPCPKATPPDGPAPSPAPPAPAAASTPAPSVLAAQVNRPGAPVEPTLPVTGFDTLPIALLAGVCLLAGTAALAAARRREAAATAGDDEGAGNA